MARRSLLVFALAASTATALAPLTRRELRGAVGAAASLLLAPSLAPAPAFAADAVGRLKKGYDGIERRAARNKRRRAAVGPSGARRGRGAVARGRGRRSAVARRGSPESVRRPKRDSCVQRAVASFLMS